MTEARRRLIEWVPEGGLSDADAILDRFTRWCIDSGFELYDAQEEALLELMTDRHVVLSTPTGSGKSLVALGMHFKALCEEKRSFYTAPIKALVSEKFFALCNEFGPENVGMLTGDAAINWAAPIICCTAEVLANMALRQGGETDAPYVVMDEFHYFSDRDRGWAWQVPLLSLPRTCFLLMSATLGNTSLIEERIQKLTNRDVAHVYSDERPVPLDFSYRETPIIETVESLLASGHEPIYIVHFTQREAAEQAQGLTSAQITDKDEKRALTAAIGGFRFDTPYGKDVQRFLKFGIGLHHAGVLPKYRLLVERLAGRGLLKVICGTDTLGVGVNIPIRTVLFTKLSKYDGEKVGILSVRNFKQIAGRAGRRGFDTEGSVVCQAPEHVIENLRSAAKSTAKGRKKDKKKPPPRGFVAWSADTFEQLAENPPETLRSQMTLGHGTLVALLQRGEDQALPGSGYAELIALVDKSFESPSRKKRLRRETAVLFRSLRHAGIVRVEQPAGVDAPVARIDAELQRDFGLHHTLSLYLVDAVAALDPGAPDYALDVLSIVEAILENPRALLQAQVRERKSELIAQLKADRVPYEERMEKLESVTWDKPNADFLYSTFDLFETHHPWVGQDSIRPKSIAREMWEGFLSFEDYVRRYGLARMEGVLLRYLSQVHSTLAHDLPETARNDEVLETIAFFRALLARVDSSLVEEWESLVNPQAAPVEPTDSGVPDRAPRRLDRRSFNARARAELHQLVLALSKRDFEAAAACVANEDWDPARFETALAPLFAGQAEVRADPEARKGHWTRIEERGELGFDLVQTLVDDTGEGGFQIEATVDLAEPRLPAGPMLRIQAIRE